MMKKIITLLCISIFSIFLAVESYAEEQSDEELTIVMLHETPGIGKESREKILESVISLLKVSILRGEFLVFNGTTLVHKDFAGDLSIQNMRDGMNIYISEEKPFLTYTVVRTWILANEDGSDIVKLYNGHVSNSRELSSASVYSEIGKDIAQTIAKLKLVE